MSERKEMFLSGLLLSALIIGAIVAAIKMGVHIETAEPAAAAEEITEAVKCGAIVWKQDTPTPTEPEELTRMICENMHDKPAAIAEHYSETEAGTPTPQPTAAPTATNTPTPKPTKTPTPKPTKTPTPKPTKTPTPAPILNTDADGYKPGTTGTKKVSGSGHAWKPYARHTAITAKGSPQYKLQKIAKTDSNGLRYVTDPDGVKRYCVALPVYWAGGTAEDIGRCFDVTMKNGAVLHCVLGDVKKQEHSKDGAGRFGSRGELLEFQVDQERLPDNVRRSGDISSLGGAFDGEPAAVTVYGFFIDGFGG